MSVATIEDAASSLPRPDQPVPATVLVGFLGAGKTSLLNHLLADDHGRKIAVIVNDFSEVNVDARLVRQTSDRLVEMTNGCICCTLREDLVEELRMLSAIPGLDGIVIESTGIGEPMPIAQAFHMEDLPERVALQEIVTVVDAANFWTDFERTSLIEDAEGNPVVAPLLVDQLEFTNVVLLNKSDLADEPAMVRLEGFVQGLNSGAKIYRTVHGTIAVDLVRNTQLYDYGVGPETEAWDETWDLEGASEADEYGFNTFTFVSASPCRHADFMVLFEDWPDEILRAKGIVSFVDHPPLLISVVRDTVDLQTLLAPEDEALLGAGAVYTTGLTAMVDGEEIQAATEIVFIGREMPVDEIVDRLDACIPDS